MIKNQKKNNASSQHDFEPTSNLFYSTTELQKKILTGFFDGAKIRNVPLDVPRIRAEFFHESPQSTW